MRLNKHSTASLGNFFGQVALNVDVEEGGDTPETHGSAVLALDRGEVAEIGPLDGFLGIVTIKHIIDEVEFY